jgi:erythromycin esterase
MVRKLLAGITLVSISFFTQAQGYFSIVCDSSRLATESVTPFIELVKDKQIIGLGEATHGTHEFFTTKAELIKILVQQADVRILAFETGFDAYQVNKYLTGNSNDLASLMRTFYLIYHTREFIELLQWLQRYNLSVPEEKRVTVYGVDSQHISNLPSMVMEYLEQVDPLFINEADSKLQELQDKLSSGKRTRYLENIEFVIQHMNERRAFYIKQTSERKLNLTLKALETMKSAVNQSTLINDHGTKAQTLRDEAMLENVKWITKYESDSKIILWGHNGHIQKVNFNLKKKDHFRLGVGLHQEFGSAYYAIGFDFDKGSFNAVNYQNGAKMQPCYVNNEKSTSFAAQFKHVELPCYFIDFNVLSVSDKEKLTRADCMRESGIGFSGEEYTFVNLKVENAFDGMVFVQTTTPSTFMDVRKIK